MTLLHRSDDVSCATGGLTTSDGVAAVLQARPMQQVRGGNHLNLQRLLLRSAATLVEDSQISIQLNNITVWSLKQQRYTVYDTPRQT